MICEEKSIPNILLTSSGITSEEIEQNFKNSLLPKKIEDVKVLILPTAVVSSPENITEEIIKWLNKQKRKILKLGVKEENISIYNFEYDMSSKDLSNYDVIYGTGGNTFNLMNRLRETGFDNKLIDAIKRGLVYVGVSAGSIIMGQSIETALPFDDNKCNLENFEGLNIFDGIVIPHYSQKREKIVDNFKKFYSQDIYTIPDGGAIHINGGDINIIKAKNNFEVLGVSYNCTIEEVKDALISKIQLTEGTDEEISSQIKTFCDISAILIDQISRNNYILFLQSQGRLYDEQLSNINKLKDRKKGSNIAK